MVSRLVSRENLSNICVEVIRETIPKQILSKKKQMALVPYKAIKYDNKALTKIFKRNEFSSLNRKE